MACLSCAFGKRAVTEKSPGVREHKEKEIPKREITFGGFTYPIKLPERQDEETRTLGLDQEAGWIG
jgi:hypothetical protein